MALCSAITLWQTFMNALLGRASYGEVTGEIRVNNVLGDLSRIPSLVCASAAESHSVHRVRSMHAPYFPLRPHQRVNPTPAC